MAKDQEKILNDPEQLLDICRSVIRCQAFLSKNTPDWEHDERINELWIWCTTHKDRYDSSKGKVVTWVGGVSRRIIDSYRKYKSSRTYYTVQFPATNHCDNEPLRYEEMLPDTTVNDSLYDKKDLDNLFKVLDSLPDKNKLILTHCLDTIPDSVLSDMVGMNVSTLRSRRTQIKRKVKLLLLGLGSHPE